MRPIFLVPLLDLGQSEAGLDDRGRPRPSIFDDLALGGEAVVREPIFENAVEISGHLQGPGIQIRMGTTLNFYHQDSFIILASLMSKQMVLWIRY